MKIIDMRSDTVTAPTQEMREAMYRAEVGDDVYGDDPTVIRLEKYAAGISGKEAALFVPSGTFGNQLALLTHCRRGAEVLLGDDCHIVEHEVGASSVIAGVQLRTFSPDRGELSAEAIKLKIRDNDIHCPETGLICLENARANGTVVPLPVMEAIHQMAKEAGIPVHLDGARLFNAAEYLKVDASQVASHADSVMFCLSKGLCAPVGSILAGSREFIDRARKGRKLMGGGMRQAGILAAAGLIALEKMTKRLGEDHANALQLGKRLSEIPGVKVNQKDIHVNMVFFDLSATGCETGKLMNSLEARGIRANPPSNGMMRLVTHYWTNSEDIEYVASTFKEILQL